MILFFSPSFSGSKLAVSRFGDTLIINGAPLDLSVIPEGGHLTHEAIGTPYIWNPVERKSGTLVVPLTVPIPFDAGEFATEPWPSSLDENGPVLLPGQTEAVGIPATEPAINVDLSQLETPATRLAAKRAAATMTRREFALALEWSRIISMDEATDFATGVSIPDKAQAYVDTLPARDGEVAKFTLRTADTVYRMDGHVIALATAEGKPPEWLDALFGIV